MSRYDLRNYAAAAATTGDDAAAPRTHDAPAARAPETDDMAAARMSSLGTSSDEEPGVGLNPTSLAAGTSVDEGATRGAPTRRARSVVATEVGDAQLQGVEDASLNSAIGHVRSEVKRLSAAVLAIDISDTASMRRARQEIDEARLMLQALQDARTASEPLPERVPSPAPSPSPNTGTAVMPRRDTTGVRLPSSMPAFRQPALPRNVDDAEQFINAFENVLIGNDIPQAKWANALLACTSYAVSQWVRRNIMDEQVWPVAKARFLEHYHDRLATQRRHRDFIELRMAPSQSLDEFADLFLEYMDRLGFDPEESTWASHFKHTLPADLSQSLSVALVGSGRDDFVSVHDVISMARSLDCDRRAVSKVQAS